MKFKRVPLLLPSLTWAMVIISFGANRVFSMLDLLHLAHTVEILLSEAEIRSLFW